jgi:hypothetical protein
MRRLAARSGSRDDLTRRNETWLQSRRQPICQPLETRTTAISAVLSYRQCFINCVRLTSRTGSPGALAASATSSGSGTRPGSVGRPRRRSHPCSPDYATLVHSGDPAFPEICAKMPRPLDTPRNSTRISASHCCSHEQAAPSHHRIQRGTLPLRSKTSGPGHARRLVRAARIIGARGRQIPRASLAPAAPIPHNPEVQIMDRSGQAPSDARWAPRAGEEIRLRPLDRGELHQNREAVRRHPRPEHLGG